MEVLESAGIVKRWLWIGFIMVIVQIFLGGITRLTGSGLSITHWDIITGILFPMNTDQWNFYFDLYKKTPQYLKINEKMNLDDFKFIFFWEYLHRLWARFMGLVFVIPLVWFLWRKLILKNLVKNLFLIFVLAIVVASLGWIMVASGLTERPWVNAYKLSFHLSVAVILLCYIYITIHKANGIVRLPNRPQFLSNSFILLIGLVFVQIFLGGVMAGMKASLISNTWPTINGLLIPREIFLVNAYREYLFSEYELSHTGPIIVQFFHRSLAYLIFLFCSIFPIIIIKKYKNFSIKPILFLLLFCFFQAILGILTLTNSYGFVPLWLGAFHQLFGILLLVYLIKLYLSYGQFIRDDS